MQNVHSIKYGTYIKTSTYEQIKSKKNSRFYYNTISVNTNVIYHEVDFFSSKTITAYNFLL